MIDRQYFFRVESLPPLVDERLANGQYTVVTGIVGQRTWLSNPERARQYVLDMIGMDDTDMMRDEIIITSLSRVK